jgi:hypothetical protein
MSCVRSRRRRPTVLAAMIKEKSRPYTDMTVYRKQLNIRVCLFGGNERATMSVFDRVGEPSGVVDRQVDPVLSKEAQLR